MIFFIFGIRRSTGVSPNEAELLQGNVCCMLRGCGGRVNVLEYKNHFHICFIPLCLLEKKEFVRCQRCKTTISLLTHMGTSSGAKPTNISIAKARWVQKPPESVEMGIHDESIPILDKLEEGDGERATYKNNRDGTTMVEAADATIV